MFQTISDVFVKHIKPTPTTSAHAEARRRTVTLGIDVPILLVIATLLIFGILMVYSASWYYSFLLFNAAIYIFTRQVLWLILGVGAAVVLTFMDYHWWRRLAVPAMAVA